MITNFTIGLCHQTFLHHLYDKLSSHPPHNFSNSPLKPRVGQFSSFFAFISWLKAQVRAASLLFLSKAQEWAPSSPRRAISKQKWRQNETKKRNEIFNQKKKLSLMPMKKGLKFIPFWQSLEEEETSRPEKKKLFFLSKPLLKKMTKTVEWSPAGTFCCKKKKRNQTTEKNWVPCWKLRWVSSQTYFIYN